MVFFMVLASINDGNYAKIDKKNSVFTIEWD